MALYLLVNRLSNGFPQSNETTKPLFEVLVDEVFVSLQMLCVTSIP